MRRLSMVVVLMFVLGCTNAHRSGDGPKYVHFVAMWLKDRGNREQSQKIIETSSSFLGKIPGLLDVHAGPMQPSTRPVVDSSYDVGLVMIFDSQVALTNYPMHPLHQRAMREVIGPLVDHYKVYDFADRSNQKGTPR